MCSYCGCRSIEVIGRFMTEHEDIVTAAGALRRAAIEQDRAKVRMQCERVRTLLTPHTEAEEVGLFSVMREQGDFAEQVDALCGEHTLLDAQLDGIAAGDYSLVQPFSQRLRDHIDKEDNGLFPTSALTLDGPDWDRIDARTPVINQSTPVGGPTVR